MSARKRGKNRGDETTDTEMTPKIHNGVKMMSLLSGAGDDEQTGQAGEPSRIAGLFRSRGLVRRRSLGRVAAASISMDHLIPMRSNQTRSVGDKCGTWRIV
jgi:hypothetical protein